MMLHIGLDDTDSPEGGCTTYVAAVLVERLMCLGADFKGPAFKGMRRPF